MIIANKCPICGKELIPSNNVSAVIEIGGISIRRGEYMNLRWCGSCKSNFTTDLQLINYHGKILLPLRDPLAPIRETKKEPVVLGAVAGTRPPLPNPFSTKPKRRKSPEEQFAEFLARWHGKP
jgi:hypothetical protein